MEQRTGSARGREERRRCQDFLQRTSETPLLSTLGAMIDDGDYDN